MYPYKGQSDKWQAVSRVGVFGCACVERGKGHDLFTVQHPAGSAPDTSVPERPAFLSLSPTFGVLMLEVESSDKWRLMLLTFATASPSWIVLAITLLNRSHFIVI